MNKTYELPKIGSLGSRRVVAEFDENGIAKITEQALDSLICELNEYAEREPKTGHCKECKYFEYDSVAKVDGVPLIVAHEICNKWGDGCKTKEDGYCFLFEPQKSEVQE